ncbi:MAG: DUF3365 domain-containing protein, partial [Nitrospinae bacterium]|nr:DUF3365 domain-containing protein [Nitrospinota bacterium]
MRRPTSTSPYSPRGFLLLAALLWTGALSVSLLFNITSEHNQAYSHALLAARAYYAKDLSYRLWATKHGGVYVPVSEGTPPNPYLAHVPDRDITTTSGKHLTLMNPAYMLREVMGDFEALYGVRGHITSLQLMNPINQPDGWERQALASFKKGEDEVAVVQEINGVSHLRYMKPIVTKEGCLKCHGIQGYKVGDIRGGVSLSVPLAPYVDRSWEEIRIHAGTHFAFWIIGLGGILLFSRQLARSLAQRKEGEAERERLIAGIEQSADGMIITDRNGIIEYVNPGFETISGYTSAEAVGKTPRILKSDAHGLEFYQTLWGTILSGRTWKGTITNRRKDGSLFHDETTISPTFDPSGAIVSFVAVIRDVSREQRLQRARDYFTAVTSHELRTPLSKINLLLLLVGKGREEGAGPTATLEKMKEVTESLYDDLDWMMRQTGTISEINLSWQQKRYEAFYVYLTVDASARRAQDEVKRHRREVAIRVVMEESFHQVMAQGNERMIAAALDNLLSNGVKYTPDGKSVHLLVSVAEGRVRITVRDEGRGMSKEAISEAFVPYFSGEEVEHHASGNFRYMGGGVGRGLNIVEMGEEFH